MSSSESSESTSQPSMLYSHAAYVAGAAKEAIGSYTSDDLKNAGAADKQAAVEDMRAAKAQADQQGGELNKNSTLGKVEQTLGNVAGCEGMEDEGAKRQS